MMRPTPLLLLLLTPAIALGADFPAGSYTAHGDLTIVFDAQGMFHVTQGGKAVVNGKYQVKGDQLEMTDQGGPWACTKAGLQSGTYRWKVGDGGLTLAKLSDACKEREGTLATSIWKQQ